MKTIFDEYKKRFAHLVNILGISHSKIVKLENVLITQLNVVSIRKK